MDRFEKLGKGVEKLMKAEKKEKQKITDKYKKIFKNLQRKYVPELSKDGK